MSGENEQVGETPQETPATDPIENEGTPPAEGETPPENVEPEAPSVPDKYEDFTMPEGIEVDTAMMDEFKPLAKELGLTQEAAQKLIDIQTKHAKAFADAEQAEWDDLNKQWQETAKADKEIGGDKLPEVLSNVNKVLEKLGTEALTETLEWSGMNNNPEVVRLLNRIYVNFMKEDNVEPANAAAATTEKSRADRIFPSMSS